MSETVQAFKLYNNILYCFLNKYTYDVCDIYIPKIETYLQPKQMIIRSLILSALAGCNDCEE